MSFQNSVVRHVFSRDGYGVDVYAVADANWTENSGVRLYDDIIAEHRQTGSSPDVFASPEFAAESGERHQGQIASRVRLNRHAARIHNHESFAEVDRRTDVRAGEKDVDVPEKSRQIFVIRTVEMVRDAIKKHADERRVQIRAGGFIRTLACQQRHESAVVGAKPRARLLPAKSFKAHANILVIVRNNQFFKRRILPERACTYSTLFSRHAR